MNNSPAADSSDPLLNISRPFTPSRFLTHGGRISRLEFFWTHLFCIAIAVAGLSMIDPTNIGLSFLALSPVLFAIYLCIVIGIKRCHDLGKSGWLYTLTMGVPVVNFGTGLYLLFAKGMDTPNGYGPATNTATPTSLEISLGSNEKSQRPTVKIRCLKTPGTPIRMKIPQKLCQKASMKKMHIP
jgi:uncharacterized membrane protein YhaH (DUF805 family)